jgi:hypothetical protein
VPKERKTSDGGVELVPPRGPRLLPEHEVIAKKFRFSDDPATAKQLAALDQEIKSYGRRLLAKMCSEDGFTIPWIADLMGLQERQGKAVVGEACQQEGSARFMLVLNLLHGMLTGKFAGILGTPVTADRAAAFKLVYQFDPRAWVGEIPDWVHEPIGRPVDDEELDWWRTSRKLPDGRFVPQRIAITEDGVVPGPQLYRDPETGKSMILDASRPQHANMLPMFHGAFCVEYLEWTSRRDCDEQRHVPRNRRRQRA